MLHSEGANEASQNVRIVKVASNMSYVEIYVVKGVAELIINEDCKVVIIDYDVDKSVLADRDRQGAVASLANTKPTFVSANQVYRKRTSCGQFRRSFE